MRFKPALTALVTVSAAYFATALWTPASAMGPVGPTAAAKTDNSLVENVRRRVYRRYYRGRDYYPRARWYGYRSRPSYYSYYQPDYYYAPRYYQPYYYPSYGSYYGGPRFYGYGSYGYGGYGYRPRFGLRIGF